MMWTQSPKKRDPQVTTSHVLLSKFGQYDHSKKSLFQRLVAFFEALSSAAQASNFGISPMDKLCTRCASVGGAIPLWPGVLGAKTSLETMVFDGEQTLGCPFLVGSIHIFVGPIPPLFGYGSTAWVIGFSSYLGQNNCPRTHFGWKLLPISLLPWMEILVLRLASWPSHITRPRIAKFRDLNLSGGSRCPLFWVAVVQTGYGLWYWVMHSIQ